jgi:uncharacterized protein YlxW (UPF0749 family)
MSKVDELTLKIDRGEAVTPEELAQARAADDLEQLQAEAASRVAEQQAARHQEEERTAKIAQLVEIAARGNKQRGEYERARRDLNEAAKKHGQRMVDAVNGMRRTRREFIALARAVAPGFFTLTLNGRRENEEQLQSEVDAVLAELTARGADLTTVGNELLGGQSVIDRPYAAPKLEHGEAVSLVEQATWRSQPIESEEAA